MMGNNTHTDRMMTSLKQNQTSPAPDNFKYLVPIGIHISAWT